MYYTTLIHKEKMQNLIEQIPKNSSDMIFISGSLVQGIGNKYSDIDVFVLSKDISANNINDLIEYDEGLKKTGFMKFEEINVDIEYWDLSVVRNIIRQVNSIYFSDPDKRIYNLLNIEDFSAEDTLSFLHRFYIGEFVRGKEALKRLRKDINFENYFKLKGLYLKVGVDNVYEDILGNISEKNYFNALILLRRTIHICLGIELNQQKVSFDREKWIYPLFIRTFGVKGLEKIHDVLWKEVTDDNVEELIAKGMGYMNEVLGKVNYE